ncbi:Beta-barrel assembly-enhancing protease [subsurface metagenome]
MTRTHRKPRNKVQHNDDRAARKVVSRADARRSSGNNKALLPGLALAGIILLGLVLRISYLREIVHNPDFSFPQIDAGYYDYWARGLATGDWTVPENFSNFVDPEIRVSPYFRPPGYPFFLAFVYHLSNGSYLTARIVQMALGLANCVLAYFLGKAIFGRRIGLVFALFVSVYWAFIYFEGELLAPVLLVTLALSLIYVLSFWPDKLTFQRGCAGGVFLGLCALARTNFLLFGPVVLVWSGWIARQQRNGRRIGPTWLGFVLGAVVVIAPVTIRNWIVARDLVLIASNAGISLYTGNHEQATGRYSVIPNLRELGLEEEWTCFDYPRIVRGVELLNGKRMKHSEVSSYFTKKSIAYVRSHPKRTLKLLAIKAALFWGPVEVPNNKVISCEKANSATLRYMPGFPLAVSLAVLGLIHLFLGRRNLSEQKKTPPPVTDKQFQVSILILLFTLTYFVSYLPFFMAGRYRVPVIPFFFLSGAYGLCRVGRLFVSGRYYAVAGWLAILVSLYFVASIRIVPYEPDAAQWHLLRATCYRLAKKPELAVKECQEVVRIRPDLEKGHRRLADMLFQKKDNAGAIQHYTKAVQLKPYRFDVHYHLGLALSSQGELDKAISHFREALRIKPVIPEVHYSLGTVLKSKGQIETAIDHYRQALKLKPDYTKARYSLATTLLAQGKSDEAISHARWILKHNPNQASAHNLLGGALKSKGKIDEAIGHYHQALKLRPDYHQAHNNLAGALLVHGKVDEAISHYRQALKIKPDYREAQLNMNNVLRLRRNPE